MTRRSKVAIAVAIAVALAGGGAAITRQRMERRAAEQRAEEAARLAQDFAEVGQCFFGEQPKAEEITFRKLVNISNRLGGTASDWPFECRERIDRFRTRVETAHDLEPSGATRLSTALFRLDEDLRERSVTNVTLGEHLNKIWTLANASGIGSATPETAAPPLPRELALGAAKLSAEGLIALDGGPVWQFLGWDANGFAQCEMGDLKLFCKRIQIGNADPVELRSAVVVGSWSSPRFILLRGETGKGSWLLADGKLEALPSTRYTLGAHVNAAGDVTVLTEAKELKIFSRAKGEPKKPLKLIDALSTADREASRDFVDARLLGPRLLLLRPGGELYRYDLEATGKAINPMKLGLRFTPAWDRELRTCRAGAHDAILLSEDVVFDTAQGLVKHPAQGGDCSASGVVWTNRGGCTPEGCAQPLDAILRSAAGGSGSRAISEPMSRDRVGRGVAIAWIAHMGAGLLVRGNAADLGTTVVVANGDELAIGGDITAFDLLNGGGPAVRFGVYGDSRGGVVLYRNGRGPQLGVAMSALGDVSPLSIEGL